MEELAYEGLVRVERRTNLKEQFTAAFSEDEVEPLERITERTPPPEKQGSGHGGPSQSGTYLGTALVDSALEPLILGARFVGCRNTPNPIPVLPPPPRSLPTKAKKEGRKHPKQGQPKVVHVLPLFFVDSALETSILGSRFVR